ncbi:MAG: hypothetical protein WCG05_05625 [Alphaproteobacteria bacterium]
MKNIRFSRILGYATLALLLSAGLVTDGFCAASESEESDAEGSDSSSQNLRDIVSLQAETIQRLNVQKEVAFGTVPNDDDSDNDGDDGQPLLPTLTVDESPFTRETVVDTAINGMRNRKIVAGIPGVKASYPIAGSDDDEVTNLMRTVPGRQTVFGFLSEFCQRAYARAKGEVSFFLIARAVRDLPEDSRDSALETANRIARLGAGPTSRLKALNVAKAILEEEQDFDFNAVESAVVEIIGEEQYKKRG